jgi:hypothetical protein
LPFESAAIGVASIGKQKRSARIDAVLNRFPIF